jgi:hypothetical protein
MEYALPLHDVRKQSGAGILTTTADMAIMSGNCWVTDTLNGGYIEINPGTYYYDIVYSNMAGNKLYVGWEQYDSAKTSTSNNSTFYVINTTGAATNVRVKGERAITNDSGSRPVKYVKLRVLNSWESTSGSSSISFLSLRTKDATTRTLSVRKTGVVESNSYKNDNEQAHAYKNGFTSSNRFYEI